MTTSHSVPESYQQTRENLQIVATHIVARARQQAVDRFGLRVTPGGFGTPEFGDDLARVRVSGSHLVVESGGSDGTRSASHTIDGSSLRQLAEHAGIDIEADLSVGHDTPALGDIDAPLAVDEGAARLLAGWYAKAVAGLDLVLAGAPSGHAASLAQLWPEHFDVALDLAATPDRRVNLGASAGDGFHGDPYLYVGPWTDDRPGDGGFWNAPFGAVLGYDEVMAQPDPAAAAATFWLAGVALLAT